MLNPTKQRELSVLNEENIPIVTTLYQPHKLWQTNNYLLYSLVNGRKSEWSASCIGKNISEIIWLSSLSCLKGNTPLCIIIYPQQFLTNLPVSSFSLFFLLTSTPQFLTGTTHRFNLQTTTNVWQPISLLKKSTVTRSQRMIRINIQQPILMKNNNLTNGR